MTQLTKKGIWITGASSGIGRAAVFEFARTGAKVFASARRADELQKINESLKNENAGIDVLPCNVASYQEVEQTVKKITSSGNINCLINNAGITSFKRAENNSIQEINDVINTNLLGAVYAIKSVLPCMKEQGGGTIINTISVAAKKIFLNSSIYAASKAGLLAYTNSLREEVRGYNIKIINVVPGATETPIWREEVRNEKGNKMMKAEDIGRLLVWLYNQDGSMVTEEIVLRPITGDLS